MATAWSLDFCMVCDKQTLGGPYCSQTCRLAEMDKCSYSRSGSSSPEIHPTSGAAAAEWPECRIDDCIELMKSSPATSPSLSSDSYTSYLGGTNPSASSSSTSTDTYFTSIRSPMPRALPFEVQTELDHYSGLFEKRRSRHRRISYTNA